MSLIATAEAPRSEPATNLEEPDEHDELAADLTHPDEFEEYDAPRIDTRSAHRRNSSATLNSLDYEGTLIDEDDGSEHAQGTEKEKPVTWSSLPRKGQLVILTLARLSEPLVQTSLQSYMFYQLKSFNPSLAAPVIASQAGMLAAAFTGAQFLTAMVWGRLSDSPLFGRKAVLLIGLIGSFISAIGFGFSQSFRQALLFRLMAGALNGNIGVLRTMVSEIILEKKYQPRAFLLFPMCFNVGVIIGPILGGVLADPAATYPSLFRGNQFFLKFPYALPNLVNAVFLLLSAIAVFFGLEETLQSIRHKEDFGSKCSRKIAELFCWRRRAMKYPLHTYAPVSGHDHHPELRNGEGRRSEDVEMSPVSPSHDKMKVLPRFKRKLPFRKIFTHNVISTFISHFFLGFHLGTFNALWFVFLSTPVEDPSHPRPPDYQRKLPFVFTGGLGMSAQDVGFAMAILGAIGISMQLLIYPWVISKLGVVKSWRITLFAFPVAYFLIPFLSIVPSQTPPPAQKDGILIWLCLCGVLFIQVTGRTFALPSTVILINNCCPHPSVLGTVHGLGQSIATAARTIGPLAGGFLFGIGLEHGVVGGVFWGLSGLAVLNIVASFWVRNGDGHEIKLEGDDEAEAEFQAELAKRKAGK